MDKKDFFPPFVQDSEPFNRLAKITPEIENLLKFLNIPEDEWNFVLGLEHERIPEKYLTIQEHLKERGLKIEYLNDPSEDRKLFLKKAGVFSTFKDEEDPILKKHIKKSYGGIYIRFPENLKLKDTYLYLPSLLKFSYVPYPNTYIEFQEHSEGNIALGTPAPRLINFPYYLSTVEIIVKEGARANVSLIHAFPDYLDARIYTRIILQEGASLTLSLLNFKNGKITCRDVAVKMEHRSSLTLNTLSFGVENGKYYEWIEVEQKGEQTNALINTRQVSMDTSSSNSFVKVKAQKGSQGSKAHIDSKGIVLSRDAEQFSLPAFDTQENLVQMSHSAYIGQIEEKSSLYLASRGLSDRDIVYLMVESYLEEALSGSLPEHFYETMLKFLEYLLNTREIEIIRRS